jgi:hypothetical protein
MTTSKQMENDLHKKNGRQPQKKLKKGRRPKKMINQPINQNQPNWL